MTKMTRRLILNIRKRAFAATETVLRARSVSVTCISLLCNAWSAFLLLLAGDVARNPGPGDVVELITMMKRMMEWQIHLNVTIDKLSPSHSGLEATVSDKMAEIADVLQTIQEQSARIEYINVELNAPRGDIYCEQKRLDGLGDASRRQNLATLRFTEPDSEDVADTRARV